MAFPSRIPRMLWVAWALNLHIGLVAVGFLFSASRWSGQSIASPFVPLVFFAAVLVYGMDRAGGSSPEDAVNQPERAQWLRRHSSAVRFFLGVSLLLVLICLFYVPISSRLVAGFYVMLAVGYTQPILPGRHRLQDDPGIKGICVVLGWAGLPMLLPGFGQIPAAWSWMLYRAGWLSANYAWSEWRDADGDTSVGRNNLLAGNTPAQMRRLGRILLTATLVGGFLIGARADLLGPLLFGVGQETLGRKKPSVFAELADLPMILTLFT